MPWQLFGRARNGKRLGLRGAAAERTASADKWIESVEANAGFSTRWAASGKVADNAGWIDAGETVMGWVGTLFIGAVVGWLGARGERSRHAPWLIALACALAAMVIKMLGNIVGLFDDGSIAEWLCSVGAAVVMLSVMQRLPAGRMRNKRV